MTRFLVSDTRTGSQSFVPGTRLIIRTLQSDFHPFRFPSNSQESVNERGVRYSPLRIFDTARSKGELVSMR